MSRASASAESSIAGKTAMILIARKTAIILIARKNASPESSIAEWLLYPPHARRSL
jgi:hypothetical protein